MQPPTLTDQIGQAANLVGLLLALITLFTSNRSERIQEERRAVGGPRRERLNEILAIGVGLAVVTALATAALAGLAHKAVLAVWHRTDDPVSSVFLLVWLMLGALFVWQVVIVIAAIRLRREAR
jgi:hypothetical protein